MNSHEPQHADNEAHPYRLQVPADGRELTPAIPPVTNYSLAEVCPACDMPVVRYACKVRCPRCGFMWDCSEL